VQKLNSNQLLLLKKIIIVLIVILTMLATFFWVHIYLFNINSPTRRSLLVFVILWFGCMKAIEEFWIYIKNKLK